jgi:hypothetical protein
MEPPGEQGTIPVGAGAAPSGHAPLDQIGISFLAGQGREIIRQELIDHRGAKDQALNKGVHDLLRSGSSAARSSWLLEADGYLVQHNIGSAAAAGLLANVCAPCRKRCND